MTPANDSCCMITCTGHTLSAAQMEQKLIELEKNLTIPRHLTAKAKRRKISAEDQRPSATAVGSCCGIVVVTFAGVFIVVMDIDHAVRLYYFLKMLFSKSSGGV